MASSKEKKSPLKNVEDVSVSIFQIYIFARNVNNSSKFGKVWDFNFQKNVLVLSMQKVKNPMTDKTCEIHTQVLRG